MNVSPSSRRAKPTRWLVIAVTLWLVVGTACSLPGIWQPTEVVNTPVGATPQPTKAITAPAQPTKPPQTQVTQSPLPPALVESTPLPSSELGPKQPVILYFNQAMEKASVEGALQAQPAVAGSFKWLNEYAVSFTPDQPLPQNANLTIQISTKARAVNGLALVAPVELAYRTSTGLKEIDLLPKPGASDVDPSSAIVATFNRPVVALGVDPSSLVPAFTVEPEAKGRGEWLNTSTYIFYPEPALIGGKEYTLRFKEDLSATDGSTWTSDHIATWKFKTVLPKLVSISPDGKKAILLDDVIKLTFNQAMEKASVEQSFSLKAGAAPVEGKFTWNETATQVTFQPARLLERSTTYQMSLSGEARSYGGAALGQAASLRLTTVPPLSLSVVEPAAGSTLRLYDVSGTVRLRLSAPLAKQDLKKFISFRPKIGEFTAYDSQNLEVFITGTFKPSTEYTLSVSENLQDKWGAALGKPFSFNFSTSPAENALFLNLAQPYNSLVFITPADTYLPASATNIKTVQLSLGKLTLEEFARLESVSAYDRDTLSPAGAARWEKKLNLPANQSASVTLPLTATGEPLAPGLYFFSATSPELTSKNTRVLPALLISSRVHLVMKIGARQVMIWAVNLDTQQAVAGASVEIFRSVKGKLTSLGLAVTNTQGLAQLEIAPRTDVYEPLVAVVGKPGDANFGVVYSDWSDWQSGATYGIPTSYDEDGLEVYLYTDRPIYRSGQTVYFRGTINQKENGRYSAADLKQVNVKILGAYPAGGGEQPVLGRQVLPVSAYGTIYGSFELPDSAEPGHYLIDIEEGRYFSLGFQVAEYRKPEVDLSVDFSKAEIKQGEDLKAKVKALYFFGAPASALKLNWTLTTRSGFFRPLPGYQIGDWDSSWMMPRRFSSYMEDYSLSGKYITGGEAQTSADGLVNITVPASLLKENAASTNRQELILEVTVTDESESRVSARGSATLHPADFYIGIKPEVWSGQAKKPIGYTIQTFDWKGGASGNHVLKATFQKVTWKEIENWQPGVGSLFEAVFTPVATTDFKTDAQGKARLEFTPPEAGTYQLEVKGEGADSKSLLWVGGEGRAPWPKLPDQHLQMQLDAEEYSVGQSARIFIPNPLGEKTLALVTVERSKVMKAEVVVINGNNYEFTLPILADYAPNAYVSVTLLGKTDGVADFRQGIAQLNVKADALKLQVEVTADPTRAQPGGETRLKVKVKDNLGKPVQGEFSVSLMDKAVLALADANAPNIFSAFYGIQPLAVQSSLSLSIYGRRMEQQYSPPGRGGGGGDLAATPELRSEFQDTAYWKGSLETDAGGSAEIVVRLPDNLTTWVITFRGLSKDRRVGEATRELVTSKDLLLRPVTPRFLVVGDRVELAAMVHNNTSAALTAEVTLQASGVELEETGKATQKVDVAAGSRSRVSWWVKVSDVEKADLRFSAKGGGLQDASKPTWGDLPILDYASPQTFATAGILAEAGERLEVISLPRSFTPTGGQVSVEMTSSLAGTILNGLKAMEVYPYEFTEAILSRLFPNLRTYQILKNLGIESPELKARLDTELKDAIARVTALQNGDGGWGWTANQTSHPYLSAYALLALSEARSAGMFIDENAISKAQAYTIKSLATPSVTSSVSLMERTAFQYFALTASGKPQANAAALYDYREKLSPWARALLALTLQAQKAGDERVKNLVSDLESKAVRSATGAFWDPAEIDGERLTTPNFSTAVVVMALAQLDPAATVLVDAVRYLVAHRQACGCWTSSYEAAWVLAALGDVLKGTGDLAANFDFSAALNGTTLAAGKAGGAASLNTTQAVVPLSMLKADSPNALMLKHETGSGRLYYRAFLQVNRPVESAPPLQAGVSVTRRYYVAGQDCRKAECKPISSIKLSESKTVLVRLTVTVPRAMYYLALEDTIPAGTEIVNTSLKTTQRTDASGKTGMPAINAANPFGEGWNWWVFGAPQIYDQRIFWMGSYVPAGTYEVTYRLTPLQVGEYRAIPARVYQNYFPEVQGTSAGAVFTVLP